MEETNKEKTGEQEKFAAPGESSFDAAGEFNLPKTDAANQKDASANEPGPKPSRENQDSSPIYQQYIIENAQTINSSFGGAEEEKKKLSDISLDDLGAISPLSKKWFDIKTARDADLFEDNFQTLMKENICFITSQNPESRWALVYHIQKQASFLNKNCKEVFFPDNEEADYSNMLDLISSLKDQKELLLSLQVLISLVASYLCPSQVRL